MSETAAKVGIVIPTYREHENIAALLRQIVEQVPGAFVFVVDDSPDEMTVQAVRALALPHVSVIKRPGKGGRGSAVMEGLRALLDRGRHPIVEMDADFSHPPKQLPALLREAEERRLDLLIASRYLPQSRILNWPASRRVFSRLSNKVARALLGVPVADYTNGYRVYSKEAAQCVSRTCGKLGKGFIALSEILVNLHMRGHRIGETPTVFVNRSRGESSVNRDELVNAATGLFKILRHLRLQSKKQVE